MDVFKDKSQSDALFEDVVLSFSADVQGLFAAENFRRKSLGKQLLNRQEKTDIASREAEKMLSQKASDGVWKSLSEKQKEGAIKSFLVDQALNGVKRK